MQHITKDLNFLSKREAYSIKDYKSCLGRFAKNFNEEISLKSKSPIFFDTNVLLRYYSISFAAREKLFNFVKANKDRIFITSQVQSEFIKNREDVIQRFFEQVTNKVPKDFSADIVNKMKSFIEQHKVVLKDYPFVETGILKHKDELEEILQKLNETAESKRKEYIDLIVSDKFLDLLESCVLLDPLTNEELDIVKKDFDTLSKNVTSENTDAILNKAGMVFPGLGDLKNKPENPYGDYIIYHEILKYVLNNKCDVAFLTFDNTKGDWMNKTKSPHIHYIHNFYDNTGQILYIIDAERTLEELLEIDIESLVATESPITQYPELLTSESIEKLIFSDALFDNVEKVAIPTYFLRELFLNGYNSIADIQKAINIGKIAATHFLTMERLSGKDLNSLGLLRSCLRIVNSNYRIRVTKDGEEIRIGDNVLKRYLPYRDFIT